MEKFNQERMATLHSLTAQMFAASDPKKAAEFLTLFMDDLFPETSGKKGATEEGKARELAEFSRKTLSLVPQAGNEDWFKLNIEEKK